MTAAQITVIMIPARLTGAEYMGDIAGTAFVNSGVTLNRDSNLNGTVSLTAGKIHISTLPCLGIRRRISLKIIIAKIIQTDDALIETSVFTKLIIDGISVLRGVVNHPLKLLRFLAAELGF